MLTLLALVVFSFCFCEPHHNMSNLGFSAYSLTSLALILVLSTSHSPHHPAPVSYQLPTTMPGHESFQIPSLSTFAEIGRFCNPKATTSTAIVCNTLLWNVILELLENAKTKAFDEGRKVMMKVMMKEDIWLMGMNIGMKKKHAMPHLKKGRSWVEEKDSRIRKTRRNTHMRMVGGKGTKLDSKKERRNGRPYADLPMKRGTQTVNWREGKYKWN